MSDTSTNPPQADADTIEGDLAQAIISILETTNSPAIQRAREVIAHRLAISGDVAPSRIPSPRNITEIGGYINLLSEFGETEQRARMISAALGIAGPQVNLPQPGSLPPRAFIARPQVRPEGPQQATFTLSFTMRSDFVAAFDVGKVGNNLEVRENAQRSATCQVTKIADRDSISAWRAFERGHHEQEEEVAPSKPYFSDRSDVDVL